jgi:hypothetical protein
MSSKILIPALIRVANRDVLSHFVEMHNDFPLNGMKSMHMEINSPLVLWLISQEISTAIDLEIRRHTHTNT